MFDKSQVLNNSSTVQPLIVEIKNSRDNDDAMVINETDVEPENLNNKAIKKLLSNRYHHL
jgi:hypothetical protein